MMLPIVKTPGPGFWFPSMFVPKKQERAHDAGATDLKARVTALLACDGEGRQTPAFMIMKHTHSSEAKPDQTNHTVLDLMHRRPGYTRADGWQLKVWTAELELPITKGGQPVKQTHKVKYLINDDGDVITSQHKAWNDTVRMCMWVDLILKPLQEQRGKLLLWMDNCSVHHTQEVEERMRRAGVHAHYLPPNLTALLQPLDLCVNGPLKRHVREWAADNIARYFDEYRAKWKAGVPGLGRFRPPKLLLDDAMLRLFKLLKNEFSEPRFVENVRRTFVKCGMAPSSQPNEAFTFASFDDKRLTGICKYPTPTWKDVDLAEMVGAEEEEGEVAGGNVGARAADVLLHGYLAGECEYNSEDEAQ